MEKFRGSPPCCSVLLVGIGAGAAAYSGVFYVTGSQFYEACWQRRAKENIVGGFKDVEADNPSQSFCGLAVLLSWERAWTMLDLLLVPHHPRQQKMHRRWRVLVRMRTRRCQCSPSFGTR